MDGTVFQDFEKRVELVPFYGCVDEICHGVAFPLKKWYIVLKEVYMQGPEFEELFELCYEWSNHDAPRFIECSLKKNTPDHVKKAFEKLKKLKKEYDDACILV